MVGAMEFGALLVVVTDGSKQATEDAIKTNSTQNGTADVTTIASVEAFGAADSVPTGFSVIRDYNSVVVLPVDFQDQARNEAVRRSLLRLFDNPDLNTEEQDGYWVVGLRNPNRIEDIATHPGVRTVYPNAQATAPFQLDQPQTNQPALGVPASESEFATLGVLDSGIYLPSNAALQPWVTEQLNYVAANRAGGTTFPLDDFNHASFISGLLVAASQLNPTRAGLPEEAVKVLDVRVYSEAEGTVWTDVMARISDAVKRKPEVKVWNLSLGFRTPHKSPQFSPFAQMLDSLAQRHGVLLVISAGNYESTPQRPWPAFGFSGDDTICSPADAAYALTVGSLGTFSHADACVGAEDPAGYSRRGPGPGSLPKPDVTHYGGNLGPAMEPVGQLHSINASGYSHYESGTSFAAPITASTAARLWDRLARAGIEPSPELVRALIVHSAMLNQPALSNADLPYTGFGLPSDAVNILHCDDETFTTLHTVAIPQGRLIKHKLAIPDCLYSGNKLEMKVTATLCYPPLLDSNFGAEYCRSNVDIGIGPRVPVLKNGRQTTEFKGWVPADPKSPQEMYEEHLIEHGFKWSPVKGYRSQRSSFTKKVPWELQFRCTYRKEVIPPTQPQLAHAVITLQAHKPGMPVYRDGIRALQALKHSFSEIREQTRLRT